MGRGRDGQPLSLGVGTADRGRDLDPRQSTSRLLFKFGAAPSNWRSKLQDTFVLSTTKAGYRTLSKAASVFSRVAQPSAGLFVSVTIIPLESYQPQP